MAKVTQLIMTVIYNLYILSSIEGIMDFESVDNKQLKQAGNVSQQNCETVKRTNSHCPYSHREHYKTEINMK